jgi:hypothetical protein
MGDCFTLLPQLLSGGRDCKKSIMIVDIRPEKLAQDIQNTKYEL